MKRSIRPICTLMCFAIVLALASASFGQWTSIAPGIDYRQFSESGPNRVYVTRLNRAEPTAIVDTCLGLNAIPAGREQVSSMANRHEDTIGYWGGEWGKYRYDVVAAVNGSFFGMSDGAIIDGHVFSGSLDKRQHEGWNEWVGFVWKQDRSCFIGGSVDYPDTGNRALYPSTSQSQTITKVNMPRETDDLALYTPQYGPSTGTNQWGYEVLVELTAPAGIVPPPAHLTGKVRAVYSGIGNASLPFNHVVLSAHGASIAQLAAGAKVGGIVRITQTAVDYLSDGSTLSGNTWTGAYASLGGNYAFLREGVVRTGGTDSILIDRHPRTAIAFNASYLYFVVCDGRSTSSIGMNMSELGAFCLNRLQAVEGLNVDGGGSSTLWLNGSGVNKPSDGSERPVANGIMMISLRENLPRSTQFTSGQKVETKTAVELRRGPGENWDVLKTIPSGTLGEIRSNTVNGVYAKGAYWWNCTFGSDEGWAVESALLGSPGVRHWQSY